MTQRHFQVFSLENSLIAQVNLMLTQRNLI